MCDTLIATPTSTADGSLLFGKNSDRQRNEAQAVEYFARVHHAPHAKVSCTYISIPQVSHTHAVLLCRPFWIWGAEMGANEHGVVIGNEGLSAQAPPPTDPALIGMDLLRLGLERATTAAEAVEVITTLLERHGQGGNCGHLTPAYYHNGFMIADASEAYVLETVQRDWLLERVRGVHAVSNAYSITRDPTRNSSGLVDRLAQLAAANHASTTAVSPTNYADLIGDKHKEHIGQASERRARSTTLLRQSDGQLKATDLMRILRDHGPLQPDDHWNPRTSRRYGLCIHAGADDRPGQTTGAMVSEIRHQDSVHWVTGTAAPCISLFKPVLMDVSLPCHGPTPTDQFASRTLWWRHERLHRAALLGDFPTFIERIREERDTLESDFAAHVAQVLNGGDPADRAEVIAQCWVQAREVEDRWLTHLGKHHPSSINPYAAAWIDMNRKARFPPSEK